MVQVRFYLFYFIYFLFRLYNKNRPMTAGIGFSRKWLDGWTHF